MVRIGSRGHGGDGQPAGVAGKLGGSLFFLFFFAVGSFFEVLILHGFVQAAGQRAWQKVPCAIVTSEVQERQRSEKPYVFAVRYRYEHGGREYESSGYKRSYSGSEKYSKTQKLVRKYPAGLETSCYVNPGEPGEAVLRRDSLLIGLAFFFPLIFVVIGAGGIYFTWRRQPPEEAKPIAPIATARKRGLGRFGAAAFFGIFALVGGALLYPLGIKPIAKTIAAKSWVETPCQVLRAEVRDHDSDDGTTYSVYILYEYEFGGQTYKSDRYEFMGGSSSGYKGKARVVKMYRSAERPVCYVNPEDPSEAVLKRGFHAKLLLALFPLPFLFVGVGGIVHVLRGKQPSAAGASPGRIGALGRIRPMGQMGATDSGRRVLSPAQSPKMKFIIMTSIAVVWNAIVAGFVIGSIGEFRRGDVSWGSALFMLPFLAVGVGLAGAAVYQFLAMFNPRPTIELSTGTVPLGGAAEVKWSFVGQTSRIGELAVTLRGVEEARYRRGTDTHTDRNTFYEMELYRTSDPYQIALGQVGFVMPSDTMHSFEATNNKILWSLDVHGDIKRWPDVKESFRINVAPRMA